jgi:glycosyltransferase involved in cell wall biosynthesis
MKLYYVENIRLPTEKAHGYQIMKTCEALVKAGADLTLVVADRKNPLSSIDPFERYGISTRFKIVRLPVIDWLPLVPPFLWMPAFIFEQWTFLRSLRRWMYAASPRIWYTRSASIAQTIMNSSRDRVFVELHAMPSEREYRGLERVSGFICMTNWLAEQMKTRFPDVLSVVIPDAVDVDVFDPPQTHEEARRMLGLDLTAEIVVYGGRFSTLEEGKGLGQLDAAVRSIARSRPDVRLLLIGGTAGEFERIEGRPPLAPTTCIDLQPRPTLALYYRAADVLAMPFPNTPHYAYEMSPLKMFEYMASGTVILTSDLPSVRDVLDERSASFVAPDDQNALETGLKRLFDMGEEECASLAAQARQKIAAYTWEARAQKLTSFIQL